jgi:hypothetical protein
VLAVAVRVIMSVGMGIRIVVGHDGQLGARTPGCEGAARRFA